MDMCQAKSQVPPIKAQLMPATQNQMVQGIALTTRAEFATEDRLCSERVTGTARAVDIRRTPSLDDLVGTHNSANRKFLSARHILSVPTLQTLAASVVIFVGFFMEDCHA